MRRPSLQMAAPRLHAVLRLALGVCATRSAEARLLLVAGTPPSEPPLKSCNFFDPGAPNATEKATANDVIFRSDNQLVVEDGNRRVLVTARTDAGKWSCLEEADVVCEYEDAPRRPDREELAADEDLGKKPPVMPPAPCNQARLCLPQVTPHLTIFQSLIGGAVGARGGFKNINRVAVIGVGAGVVPQWFSSFVPGAHVDAVDMSPGVVRAAPCFGLKAGPQLNIVEGDGREYLAAQSDGAYDIVLVDAFGPDGRTPPCLATVEFYGLVREKLSPWGIALVNAGPEEAASLASAADDAFDGIERGIAPGLGNLVLRLRRRPKPVPVAPGEEDFSKLLQLRSHHPATTRTRRTRDNEGDQWLSSERDDEEPPLELDDHGEPDAGRAAGRRVRGRYRGERKDYFEEKPHSHEEEEAMHWDDNAEFELLEIPRQEHDDALTDAGSCKR